MGNINILIVRDDAIRDIGSANQETSKGQKEVGAAVLNLCLHPEFEPVAGGHARVKDASIFNHSNGISWADEVHSSTVRVFAWLGNCLRPISELPKESLDIVKEAVDQQDPPALSEYYDPAAVLDKLDDIFEKSEEFGSPLSDGHRWGRWILRAGNLSLEAEHGGGHYVDLEKIKDSASLLREVLKLQNKCWMTPRDFKYLFSALDEVFDLQNEFFPEGESRTIDSRTYLLNRIIPPPAVTGEE